MRFHIPSHYPAVGIYHPRRQAGDELILVAGVFMPLIVRSTNNTVMLVSPALVNGKDLGRSWISRKKEDDVGICLS